MYIYLIVLLRILSNSVANVYQKRATEHCSAVTVNLYSYLIMSVLCLAPALKIDWSVYSLSFWFIVLCAGVLCTIGTIALIEALRIGELSELAPINSYKSIVGLISAFILLKEVPSLKELLCVVLIVWGSYFVLEKEDYKFTLKTFFRKDICLRFFALFCTGIEASLLKKIICMSNFKISLILWAFSGFLCSLICYFLLKPSSLKIKKEKLIDLLYISISLLVMQASTNFVFSRLNVGISLALFQLSSIVSLYFGYKVFKEKNIVKKLVGTVIMLLGSTIMILS